MLLYRASTFQTPAAWAPNYQNSIEYLDRLHVAVGARMSVGPAQMRSVSRVGPARRRSVSRVRPALRRSVSCVSPALRRSVSCVSPALRRSVSPALRRSVTVLPWVPQAHTVLAPESTACKVCFCAVCFCHRDWYRRQRCVCWMSTTCPFPVHAHVRGLPFHMGSRLVCLSRVA